MNTPTNTQLQATLLHRCTDGTGEGATWLAERELLLWVDIPKGTLHIHSPKANSFRTVTFPSKLSTIVPMPDGRLLLALKGQLVAYDLEDESIETLIPLLPEDTLRRPNDGKASPDGRLFLGVMHESDHRETGTLYRVDPDLSLHPVLEKQSIPNGIVWDSSGTRMYYADSGRRLIEAYRYNPADGSILYDGIAVAVPDRMGVPDGMTICRDGNLWVAHWGGFGVHIWNPRTGDLLGKVSVPAPNVASCTFGEGGLLYITTARDGLSADELEQYPLSGSLFVAQTSATGAMNHWPFRPV